MFQIDEFVSLVFEWKLEIGNWKINDSPLTPITLLSPFMKNPRFPRLNAYGVRKYIYTYVDEQQECCRWKESFC